MAYPEKKEENAQIVKWHDEGKSFRWIADTLGIHRSGAHRRYTATKKKMKEMDRWRELSTSKISGVLQP